jgi:hypothetical protein
VTIAGIITCSCDAWYSGSAQREREREREECG